MKRTKLIGLCSAALSLACFMTSGVWAGGPIDDPEHALAVGGTCTETATSLTSAFAGTAELSIQGEPVVMQSVAEPLAISNEPDNSGSLVATGAHTFISEDGGTISTVDVYHFRVWSPFSVGLDGVLTVTDGSGRWAGARGEINVTGTLQADDSSVLAVLYMDGAIAVG